MGNCLVTKLNASVNNSDLAKVGEIVIPFIKGTPVELRLASSVSNTVSINKTKFSNKETNTVVFSTTQETVTYDGSEDCVITISDKYHLKTFNIFSGDVRFYDGLFDYISCQVSNTQDFIFNLPNYSINLNSIVNASDASKKKVYLVATGVKGSISPIRPSSTFKCSNSPNMTGTLDAIDPYITILTLENTDVSLVLSVLVNNTNITQLILNGSTKVTGDISSLGKARACTTMNFLGTQVSGTLESLGAAQYNSGSGRTSGFMKITCNGIITYDNLAIPSGTEKRINFTTSGYTIVDA